jgi:chemotaxis protein CheZ
VQRTVFRIEEMAPTRRRVPLPAKPQPQAPDAKAHNQIAQEFAAMRDMISWSKRELAVLRGQEGDMPLPRAANELRAAIEGMEDATAKILSAAESADETARNLTATLKDDYKRGLAQDVQDQVVKIYEACNFQDLTGQRISKAINTLRLVEAQIDRVTEIWGGLEDMAHRANSVSSLLNGPKLEGDQGHADQDEIDRMFGSKAAG